MGAIDRNDAVDVHWMPNPEDDAVTGYFVWRSTTPAGPLVKLNSTPLVRPDFRDETAQFSQVYQFYYSVTAANLDGESVFSERVTSRSQFLSDHEFGPMDDWGRIADPDRAASLNGFPQEASPDPRLSASVHRGMKIVFREIYRRSDWLLTVLTDPVDLWMKRWAGPKCGTCSREFVGQKDRCLECFGTGYSGGFDYLGGQRIRIAPATDKLQWTDAGLLVDRRPQGWSINWPTLHQGDIVRTLDGRMYSLNDVTRYATRGYYSRQHFVLAEVPETSLLRYLGTGRTAGQV